jgi:NADPH:quinone reductase-like Zn-dependent oxidoreductase
MRALVFQEAKKPLVLEDRPEPSPGEGQVVVELRAAALNRRDFWITLGLYPGIRPGVVLGSDGAGVVAEVGEGISPDWRGQEVIIDPGIGWGDDPRAQSDEFRILGMPDDGTFAERIVVSAEQLHPKPEHLDWQEAAALPLAGVTGYRALVTQGGVREGDRVLVSGIGGGVATTVLQFALAKGASVVVTSSSDEKIARAVELGALGGVDYREDDWAKRLGKEFGPFDVIIDSAGGEGYASFVHLARPGGAVVNFGATAGPPGSLDLFKMFWKQVRLIGSTMGSPADFDAMLAFVNEKKLRPVVDRVVQLEEGAEAVASMKSAPQFGKVVLRA